MIFKTKGIEKVGANVSPRSQGYGLGGVMKFTDRSALDAYGAHPVHQKLLVWLMPFIDPLEVDLRRDVNPLRCRWISV
jgi:hypothetical protein